jgi:hypothetical protein
MRTMTAMIGLFAMSMPLAAQAQNGPTPRVQLNSPLRLSEQFVPAAEFVVPLELDPGALEAIRALGAARLAGFPIGPGQQISLDVSRFDIFAPDATIVVADGEREINTGAPDVLLLRGTVVGAADSAVFLALSPHGSNGYIRLPHQSWIISTPPAGGAEPLPTVVYELSALPEGAITWAQFQCGSDQLPPDELNPERLLQRAAMMHARTTATGSADGLPCRRVRMAVDSDWQYTGTVFGGNTSASQAYATTLLAAVSEIYIREVNTSLEVVYLRVWSTSSTPYSATSVNDRLTEFRSHWNSNMSSVSRHVAHLLSGLRSGAGGIAYLGVLCGTSNSYGVSGYMNGAFPYPLLNNHWQNWDLMVAAHEIGHNFNAPHTHSMTPPIDGCGNSDCSLAAQGTIMSYCHTCAGGMTNIRLDLHARVINERILPYLNSASCASSLLCPTPPGACCLPWGGCEFIEQQACTIIPGATFAPGIQCQAAGCQQAGACCLTDGTCVQVTESLCSTIFSGTFRGMGVNCGEGRCALPPMLWNHGPLLTNAAGGCSGRAVSAVQTTLGNNSRGYSWALSSNSRIADAFIVPEGEEWTIDAVQLFGYDVSSTSPNFTSVRIQIWDGDPRDPASSVIAGDLATNRLTSATMLNMHRALQSGLTSCDRRIQELNCTLNATLGPGTYWIDRTAAGPSAPWMPPVTFAGLTGKPGGQSLQFISGAWNELRDGGTNTPQDLPFILLGSRSSSCYANCDGSTAQPTLNIDDFTCFLNEFALAQALPHAQQVAHYANCDGSTGVPALNIEDFTCFINRYALGCP